MAIPDEEGKIMSLEGLVASGGDCLKHTTKIEILPCHSNVMDGSFRRYISSETNMSDFRASVLPTPHVTASLFNLLLRLLLRRIPSNQLSVFWWVQGLVSSRCTILRSIGSWSDTKFSTSITKTSWIKPSRLHYLRKGLLKDESCSSQLRSPQDLAERALIFECYDPKSSIPRIRPWFMPVHRNSELASIKSDANRYCR